MPIKTLCINNFRNFSSAELTPCLQGLNIICGNNGSGKTSLLEAIHYLGSGRSFRSSTLNQLIKHETEKFSIFSQILTSSEHLIPIGIERETTGLTTLKINKKQVTSVAELAQLLPVRVINSHCHQMLESGPAYRRKFLDWGLFYHKSEFLSLWRQFERVLKQRNSVLKLRRPKVELEPWTTELVALSMQIDKMRREYLSLLEPVIASLANELLMLNSFSISYDNGWNNSADYNAVLQQHYMDEYRLGTTQFGPHRADIDLFENGTSVRQFLSRGQQKLLICAMILAQGTLFNRLIGKSLIYLIDDLPSELDEHSQYKLLSLLTRQQAQIFITAIDYMPISQFIRDLKVESEVFHVEHGKIVKDPANKEALEHQVVEKEFTL